MGVIRNAPEASSKKKKSTTLLYLFELESRSYHSTSTLSSPKNGKLLPSFESENDEILSAISICNTIFTFTDPSESPSEQDLKRVKLNQLLSFTKSLKKALDDRILSRMMSMLSANLFRPLPPPSNTSVISDLPDELEELFFSPGPLWPHLQIVYDILQRLVINLDPKILREYIDHRFLLKLVSLFQSEDPRERDSLKNVYHRIYARFTFYRSSMRKSMNDVFLHYVFETEKHCGIGELLEIWGSIINGFTVPLKEEHKLFLMRVLIPLHKTKGMQVYHRQLAYCVSQFVQKEPAIGGVVVRGILKYWPITNCQKEILLIGELEELVENIDPDQFRKLALPLCTQITRCLNSCNSQVAERALYVWNNEQFVKMTSTAIEEVFPVIVQGMERNLKLHWSISVKQLTQNVKVMVEEMDPSLYYQCLQDINLCESEARRDESMRKERWEKIENAAAVKNQFLQQTQSICVSH
ncbi:hypothetical protein Dsin_024587 [Dipteronia sinensis]|uniref:Serine/threonine protein phosphatase 2A regulatory subunit n=1 Tax=Dipteronia sinensis TaxID=43782 RepID=A0AAE0DW61_9ROSI|nr:hypothetical protein Dsin_024587 [Dipteronia sinensis]